MPKYSIEFNEESSRWIAQEAHEDGMVFYGYGESPVLALEDVKCSHESLNKALSYEEIIKDPSKLGLNGEKEKSPRVGFEEKPKFKPRDTFKNQVIQFIDNLGADDICQLNISTDVMLAATPTGVDRKAGDMYLAMVARKFCDASPEYVLQETIDYPAKKTYEFFQTVK